MKISVSMLSAYLFCSRKLFLEKVFLLREPPKESTVLGSIRHEIYDHINRNEEKIVTSFMEKNDYTHFKEVYKKSYMQKVREIIIKNKFKIKEVNLDIVNVFKRTWPYIMSEAETRAQNIFEFIQKYDVYGKELWEKLTPKIISEIRLDSDNLQLRGIVDKVEIYEKRYVPIELKTGKVPKEGIWPGHRIQIVAYSLLLEEKFSTKIKEAFIHYLDEKEIRQVVINPFMKEEVLNLVKEIQETLNKKELPDYCENKNKCVKCGLRETCYDERQVDVLVSGLQ